jgi:DNA invertase Pin-like site-specific DNA recombinase
VDDRREGSTAGVEGAFAEYCRLNMHQPIKTFVSVGAGEERGDAEYRRMIEYMRESGSEFLVVVPDAGHLGAELESVARSIVELEGIGASVVCSDEEFPNPMQNAFQTLGVKGVSRTRSRRIKESMRARALQGQVLGRPPYGYRIGPEGKLEIVPEEATVVELIYRLYGREGLGLRLIARQLNESGTPTRRGGNWNVVSIRDILRNAAYTGTYTRYGMRRPKVHEAIVAPELFRSAQNQSMARRPRPRVVNVEPFLLSGGLYCGYCGNKMMGVTRRQSWKHKDGRRVRGVYRYYQCQSRNNQSVCAYHTWRATLLEGAVLTQLRHRLAAKASQVEGNGGAHARWRDEAQAMREAGVRDAERRLLRAMRRLARGDLSVHMLGEYLKELDAARGRAAGVVLPADIGATLAKWESLDLEARRAFLAEHVVRIVVEDDAIEVEVWG